MMDHITVKGRGGTFSAYIARPKISPAPAVVVLQELFGVNAVAPLLSAKTPSLSFANEG